MKNYIGQSTKIPGQKRTVKALIKGLGITCFLAFALSPSAYALDSATGATSSNGNKQSNSISQEASISAIGSVAESFRIEPQEPDYSEQKIVKVSRRHESPYENSAELQMRLWLVTNQLRSMRSEHF
jgi:hypothetical protein